jgi:hypothetical protein
MVRDSGSETINSMIVWIIADIRDQQEVIALELLDIGIVIHEHSLR